MTLRSDVLATILAMAAVTYLCRAGGYAVFRAVPPPRLIAALLRHLPGPIFIAYIAPALAAQGWAGILAAIVVAVMQLLTRHLPAAIAAGVATMWVLAPPG